MNRYYYYVLFKFFDTLRYIIICVCICIYMCMYMCVHVGMYVYMCVYTSVCVYMCMSMCICVHMCVCMCIYVYLCVHVCAHMWSISEFRVNESSKDKVVTDWLRRAPNKDLCPHMNTCKHTWTHTHINSHKHKCVVVLRYICHKIDHLNHITKPMVLPRWHNCHHPLSLETLAPWDSPTPCSPSIWEAEFTSCPCDFDSFSSVSWMNVSFWWMADST